MQGNSSNFLGKIPTITRNLIIINVIVWFASSLLSHNGLFSTYLGLPYVTSPFFKPYQFITYMFMHGGFFHLFFNMFALFMFGRSLEIIWGPKKFLLYYIVTGLGAACLQMIILYFKIHHVEAQLGISSFKDLEQFSGMLVDSNKLDLARQLFRLTNTTMIGASGAIFGILIAFGMTFPNAMLMIMPIPYPIKAKWIVLFYAIFEFVLAIVNSPSDNVAHFAHLGGLLTGFIILLFWRKKTRYNGNNFY